MIKILIGEEINTIEWDDLLKSSTTSSYFQSPACYQFYSQLSFLKPFLFGVSDNNKLVGVVLGYLITDGILLKKYLSRRAIIPGGILLDPTISDDALNNLLVTLKSKLLRKAIYIEMRNYNDYSNFTTRFHNVGFSYKTHLNFHLPTPDKETTLKNLSSTKRRDIKLSLKDGAEIQEIKSDSDVEEFYIILKDLYAKKIKTPLFPIQFFKKLVQTDEGHIFAIKHNAKIIGGSVCVAFDKNTLYEWFVCGKDGELKNIFPSTLATWAAIEYASLNGFEKFDMMGAGKPDEGYGVREFKAKFGGSLVEHGRFLCVLNNNQYRIGESFVKIMRSNKSSKSKTINASKSNLTVVSDISKINQNDWSNFVLNHPHGNIFQTPALYNIYAQTPKHEPYILVAYEQGKIVGCLLSVVQNQYKGLLGILSSRIIVSGGPLVDNNNERIASELIENHKKIVRNKGVVIQYRNFYNLLPLNEVFRSKSFIFESHLNILIDLSKGTEKLWQELHDGRKKKVKSAINAGLTVQVSQNAISVEQIQNGYNIIKKVYESAELPLANIDLLINASKNGSLLLFELEYNNLIIGVRFVLKFKNDLYGWYAGSLSKYYSNFPNDLLIWETLKWGAENGFKLFDYGGAGNPNVDYGVRKFKIQSGGEIVNYGRYELVHKPIAYFVARTGFEFWKLFNRNK